MDVDLVFKIAAIGILVAVLNILLSRAGRDEQALMTTLAGLIVVLMLIVEQISRLFDMMKSVFGFCAGRRILLLCFGKVSLPFFKLLC